MYGMYLQNYISWTCASWKEVFSTNNARTPFKGQLEALSGPAWCFESGLGCTEEKLLKRNWCRMTFPILYHNTVWSCGLQRRYLHLLTHDGYFLYGLYVTGLSQCVAHWIKEIHYNKSLRMLNQAFQDKKCQKQLSHTNHPS